MDWQTDRVNPDFVALAESINIATWETKETRDIAQVLRNGLDHDGPAIINIFTNPNALAMPLSIKLEQVIGIANSMGKLMSNDKTAEIFDTATSDLKYLKELFKDNHLKYLKS
jgi:pyruvate dehydrogenase (quinone)